MQTQYTMELFAGFALQEVDLTYTIASGNNPRPAKELIICPALG